MLAKKSGFGVRENSGVVRASDSAQARAEFGFWAKNGAHLRNGYVTGKKSA